ncbi:hypothetical protein Gasu2_04620 [Galdieria sulphuraria]|uniref:Uncharacterized protein n=1 Tax=Galdieria sulphuraria TaxID=130081 RepID=M2WZF7_GALSU|nr:uncharacterized protein Gasu_31070 [Galdieria sulphuraria]EME29465.1 hypothetical protein Gasu_31070 [Galdieria sulphuraria]GJD06021.1 hypothetical protein Gasu2_04620 [Galdieria sulphuraria]|eukprot:XP_005705985.1 hypothetical protein Gasu_31070 [Galdieria sulphuraria]
MIAYILLYNSCKVVGIAMKWTLFISSCGERISCRRKESFDVLKTAFRFNWKSNFYNNRNGIARVQPAVGILSWVGNHLDRVVWHSDLTTTQRRGNFLTLFKLLCSTSDPNNRKEKTDYLIDKTSHPKFSENSLSTKSPERAQNGVAENAHVNPSSEESVSTSKKKRRERIPHTRERRDMFWRGVTTVNKVEAHAGLTTFALVVRSLEAKRIFSPPCSPARRGYLLADDYNLHIVASTASFGKKAVPRVKARRRLREACRRIFPFHAKRHKEYTITAHPVVLFAKWEDILADVYEALKRTNCYIEDIDS